MMDSRSKMKKGLRARGSSARKGPEDAIPDSNQPPVGRENRSPLPYRPGPLGAHFRPCAGAFARRMRSRWRASSPDASLSGVEVTDTSVGWFSSRYRGVSRRRLHPFAPREIRALSLGFRDTRESSPRCTVDAATSDVNVDALSAAEGGRIRSGGGEGSGLSWEETRGGAGGRFALGSTLSIPLCAGGIFRSSAFVVPSGGEGGGWVGVATGSRRLVRGRRLARRNLRITSARPINWRLSGNDSPRAGQV